MTDRSSTKSIDRIVSLLVNAVEVTVSGLLGIASNSGAPTSLIVATIVPIVTTTLVYWARTTVEVTGSEQVLWVQLWMAQQKRSLARVRHLSLLSDDSQKARPNGRYAVGDENIPNEKRSDRNAPPELKFLPSAGVSLWALCGSWPVCISYSDGLQTAWQPDTGSQFKITVWFSPFGVDVAKKLLLEGRNLRLKSRAQKTEVWKHKRHHHPTQFNISAQISRPLDSVVVENGIKEELLCDIERFLKAEDWYVQKGIPYRRGYLLHGPPGCGKTSLITALAGKLCLPIILIPLGSCHIGDDGVNDILSAAPRDSIVLIEDVDCAFRQDFDQNLNHPLRITMSGFLNAIDGVGAKEGRLLFLTTNHKELLKEALIRPGRVDIQYHIGYASKKGAGELFDQFFPPSSDVCKNSKARDAFTQEVESEVHSFAKLQGILMQARDDPDLAVQCLRDSFTGFDSNVESSDSKELKPNDNIANIIHPSAKAMSYVPLMVHAASCKGCGIGCIRMNNYLMHMKICSIHPRMQCTTCTLVVSICAAHAKQCSAEAECCAVPFCARLRQKKIEQECNDTAFFESMLETKQESKINEESKTNLSAAG